MKKALILYIFTCLAILYATLLYNLAFSVQDWLSTQQRSWTDFMFFKKEDITALFLVILSLTGVLVREKKGWILTTQLFYSLLGASTTFIFKLNSSMRLTILLSMVFLLIPPIVIMHTQALKDFYKIEEPETMPLNNIIAVVIAVLASFLIW